MNRVDHTYDSMYIYKILVYLKHQGTAFQINCLIDRKVLDKIQPSHHSYSFLQSMLFSTSWHYFHKALAGQAAKRRMKYLNS